MEMTLAFSTKFPKGKGRLSGKPTNFIEMIWAGLMFHDPFEIDVCEYEHYLSKHKEKFGKDFGDPMMQQKIHTMRSDKNDRWKAGKSIHPAINNRTKNRFQFAPTIPCVSTEPVSVEWHHREDDTQSVARVNIKDINIACCIWNKGFEDDPILTCNEVFHDLVSNDGFESYLDFFAWFCEDWKGKIIHWTPLTYYREDLNTFTL